VKRQAISVATRSYFMALSPGSEIKLSSCDHRLVSLVHVVAVHMPVIVLEGHRDEVAQHIAFESGHSKLQYPFSKHNSTPSLAVDLSPAPYNPTDLRALICFGGFVLGIAAVMGVRLRWGGAWSDLPVPLDPAKHFLDLCHFELKV
jgi:hypothetical protein